MSIPVTVTPYYSDDLVTIYHGDCREAYRYSPIYLWQIRSADTVRDVFDEPTEGHNWWIHAAM
jgi:hypothetical protein